MGGGGLGYLSLSDGWEWQVGRVTCILALTWDNGAPKAPELFFFGLPKGFFYPMCVYSKCSDFVENSNMREKHRKIRPPDTTCKSAFGCWPIHRSPVTCHFGGGGAHTSPYGGVLGRGSLCSTLVCRVVLLCLLHCKTWIVSCKVCAMLCCIDYDT